MNKKLLVAAAIKLMDMSNKWGSRYTAEGELNGVPFWVDFMSTSWDNYITIGLGEGRFESFGFFQTRNLWKARDRLWDRIDAKKKEVANSVLTNAGDLNKITVD